MEERIISDILIKFFEEEQWANDFLAGKLYINEAGKFITEENNFRGDNCEGSQVISYEKPILIQFTRIDNGETIELPLQALTPIKQSFEGANKVPILCASGLNKNNFIKIDSNKYQLDTNFITHMKQFGSHAVIFSRGELLGKIDKMFKEQHISALSGDVHYQEYDKEMKQFENSKEQYEQFFCKYISDGRDYDKQNEWRLILCDTTLIDNENDHLEIDIGALKYAVRIDVDKLIGGTFTININDTEGVVNEERT